MGQIASRFDPDACLTALRDLEADLGRLTSGLTEEEFHLRPQEGSWSVADCIEHLTLTGRAFAEQWDAAVTTASRRRGDVSEYPWCQKVVLRLMEPPYRMKVKTSQPFSPSTGRPMGETIDRFLAMHREFARCVGSARATDVKRTKVQSPFASIRYPIGFSFDFALAHERRHLWQAWQVRRRVLHSSTPPESIRS